MFKSRFAREMQHYSSLSEEYFRDPQLYEDSSPLSSEWVDAESFKKILDSRDVWNCGTKKDENSFLNARSPLPLRRASPIRSCSPTYRASLPMYRASPAVYRASFPAHDTCLSPGLSSQRESAPYCSKSSPPKPTTPLQERPISPVFRSQQTDRSRAQSIDTPNSTFHRSSSAFTQFQQSKRSSSPSDKPSNTSPLTNFYEKSSSPPQRFSLSSTNDSTLKRSHSLGKSFSSLDKSSPPPSRTSTYMEEDLDNLIPGGRVSQLSQMFEQAQQTVSNSHSQNDSNKKNLSKRIRRSLPTNTKLSMPLSGSSLSLRSTSNCASLDGGELTLPMSRSNSMSSIGLAEIGPLREKSSSFVDVDMSPTSRKSNVCPKEPSVYTTQERKNYQPKKRPSFRIKDGTSDDQTYGRIRFSKAQSDSQNTLHQLQKDDDQEGGRCGCGHDKNDSVPPSFHMNRPSHYEDQSEDPQNYRHPIDDQSETPVLRQAEEDDFIDDQMTDCKCERKLKPDFKLYSYTHPEATSTPSQISKVETVVSLGDEWRSDYRSLQRVQTEIRSKHRLEAEVNSLKIENKALAEQLQEARYHSKKYAALEKEVEQLTWQLDKMEDSRKVYEKATNQLVNFLDQVSVQLSTTNLHNRDYMSSSTLIPAKLQERQVGRSLADQLISRSHSRLSWGGFQPEPALLRPDKSKTSLTRQNRMLNHSYLNLSSISSCSGPGQHQTRHQNDCGRGFGEKEFDCVPGVPEEWLPRKIQQERDKFLRARSDKNLSKYADEKPSGKQDEGNYGYMGLLPDKPHTGERVSVKSKEDGEGMSLHSKEEGEGASLQSKDMEGVSLESKDSGRSTDSGSGRSTPKIQNREQLCKRAKHLVKAMKHFLAREKSRFNEEKKSSRKEIKPRSCKGLNYEEADPIRPCDQDNKVIIQISSKQKSVPSQPKRWQNHGLGSSISCSTTKLENKLSNFKTAHHHNMRSISDREIPRLSEVEDLTKEGISNKDYISSNKIKDGANMMKMKEDANVIKITNMGTVSVPVPYPLQKSKTRKWL